jgi:hypothetical protein
VKKIFLGAVLILAGFEAVHAQTTTIAAWNFENDSVAVNNNPAASTNNSGGTVTADSIGMNVYPTPNVGVTTDDVVVGKGSDTGANNVADTTNTWRVRGQAGSNGAANGWSSAAPIATQGAQFFAPTTSFSSTSYSSLQISFDWYATTQGEANLELAYTTDGTTWTDVPVTLGGSDAGLQVLTNSSSANTVTGSYLSDNALTGGTKAGQDWFTGLTATITNPNALGNANFGIELVNASTGADDISTTGSALNNSSGNWRFDNVSIAAVAAPEPGTWALLLGSAALLVAVVHAHRKSCRL